MLPCLDIFFALSLPATALPYLNLRPGDECTDTAKLAQRASLLDARSALSIHLADCLNLTDDRERDECTADAWDEYAEDVRLAGDQYEARLDLCELLGGGPYDPDIEPGYFVQGIEHPYFRLLPGVTLVYHSDTEDGLEVDEVHPMGKTIRILGVECAIVQDTVSVNGEVEELTYDYFAQDREGNVWYFGELSMSFEDGQLESLGGSWRAGEDGAKPGIVMEASPAVGDTYRQEFQLGVAEDAGTVVALNKSVQVPYGHFTHCIETRDFSPLEPDSEEHKFYAPGIGVVLELEDDQRVELVEIRVR
jgi:hypothetical protein